MLLICAVMAAQRRGEFASGWASPAFDVLQLEDYEWVTGGNAGATERGIAAAQARLGYPPERQHYFAGFVLAAEDKAQWHAIARAAEAARRRGTGETFVWALPQVLRDGFIWFDSGDGDVEAYEDVLSVGSSGAMRAFEPELSTAVVTGAGGARSEQRLCECALRFDAWPGFAPGGSAGVIAFFGRVAARL